VRRTAQDRRWCPYPDCGFDGTEDEVDEHRTYAHRYEPQEGSNLTHRPRVTLAAQAVLPPNVASYTVWIVGQLAERGEVTYFHPNARARIYNAARRMGVKVETHNVKDTGLLYGVYAKVVRG